MMMNTIILLSSSIVLYSSLQFVPLIMKHPVLDSALYSSKYGIQFQAVQRSRVDHRSCPSLIQAPEILAMFTLLRNGALAQQFNPVLFSHMCVIMNHNASVLLVLLISVSLSCYREQLEVWKWGY